MAEIHDGDFAWKNTRSADRLLMIERYPLNQWLNEQIWQLEIGVDFTEDPANFRSGLRYWAKQYGYKVRTGLVRDKDTKQPRYLMVQAY